MDMTFYKGLSKLVGFRCSRLGGRLQLKEKNRLLKTCWPSKRLTS